MITYLRLLLLPFSVLYGIIILLRNFLYDTGIFRSVHFEIPVICVGNLVVGGAGKTPVTEYLVNLLGSNRKIAILSRGYGRKTKGYILADNTATAETIGDEPMQFYLKFPYVTVAVCEDRVKGIEQLKTDHDLIILDDAFQHRAVSPGFSILLFEYHKLLGIQFLLPAGNLREPFWGYKRADLLLVTKVPENTVHKDQASCGRKFSARARKDLFLSGLAYGELKGLYSNQAKLFQEILPSTRIFLLTGIADPKPLLTYLSAYSPEIDHHNYPDHYSFSSGDIRKLVRAFVQNNAVDKLIITTEKDAQRLKNNDIKELLLNLPVYYLPVRIALRQEDKATFDQKIIDYVSGTT